MADALWIDEDYILQNTVINTDTDVKVLLQNLIFVQDNYIKPLLGSDLFDVVEAEINAQSYSARVTNLMEILKKVIINYCMAEAAPDFVYRFENKGIMKKSSENSDAINPDELKVIADKYRNRAEIYTERAKNYLIQNNSTYPEYLTGNSNIDDIQPTNDIFKTGIWLGGENDFDCEYRKRNV